MMKMLNIYSQKNVEIKIKVVYNTSVYDFIT